MRRPIALTALAAAVLGLVVLWLARPRGTDGPAAPVGAWPVPEAVGTAELATLEAPRSSLRERSAEVPGGSSAEPVAMPPPDAEIPGGGGRTLVLRVERDGFPAAGLPVWIHPRYQWRTADRADVRGALPAGALFAETDPLGRVEFTGLGRDPYLVGLRGASVVATTVPAGSGSGRPDRYPSIEVYPGHDYTFAIGSASVFGSVFDAEGRPRPGVGLQISNAAPDAHHVVLAVQTITDELGRYELAHIAAGEHVVAMEPDGRFDGRAAGGGQVWRQVLTLEPGEARQLDFGSQRGLRWTGRLLNAFDEPFEGTGDLRLEELERGERVTVTVDASGRFDAELSPGLWQVHAHCTGSPSGGFDLGPHRIERDREQDLVVPGIRLRGRLTPPDEIEGDPATHSWTTINLQPRGHDYPAAFRRVNVDPHGRYAIDGLEPGTWLVSIWPGQLAGTRTIEVVLEPEDRDVVVDLVR